MFFYFISDPMLSRLQMKAWRQIVPLLKIFLQKELVFYILLLPLPCLYSLIHILICNTEIDKNLKHGNKIRKDMVG